MIKIRNKWLMICNSVLSFVLTLFGISSCESADEYGTMVCEYGTPYAEYVADGTVIDEDSVAVQEEEIIVRQIYPNALEGSDYVLSDTTKTDENGKYEKKTIYDFYPSAKIRIVAHDPTGTYEDDSVEVAPEKIAEGHGSWNTGVYGNTQDFKLKKK